MLTLLSALAAAAQAAPMTAATPAEDDPVVCQRRAAPMVGTRLGGKKTCMKKSEWAEMERRTDRQLQKIHNHSPTRGMAEGR